MNDDALIDKVVARVMALLRGEPVDLAPRHVLMLFSGASMGFMAGMEAIRRLSGSPHSLTVVLSPSAGQIITEAHVRGAGAVAVIGPGQWADAPALVHEADLLLMPTLSMSTAARIAVGLMDSLPATLVIGALLAGKPVVAIRDGAEPRGSGGEIFGAVPGAAPALCAVIEGHLATLESFGVELVREPDFLLAVERRLIGARGAAPALAAAPAPVAPVVSAPRAGFITDSDLIGLMPGSTLRLAAGSRLTPQAQDTARRLRLTLEQA